MANLKVWRKPGRIGGHVLVCVVAAPTITSAAACFGVSRAEFNATAHESTSEHEHRVALRRPGQVFCRESNAPAYLDESWEA